MGSAILEFASQNNYQNNIEVMGIPDTFIEHGSINELQKSIGLDIDGIKNKILSLL